MGLGVALRPVGLGCGFGGEYGVVRDPEKGQTRPNRPLHLTGGRMTSLRGSTSHQRPRQVNFPVPEALSSHRPTHPGSHFAFRCYLYVCCHRLANSYVLR